MRMTRRQLGMESRRMLHIGELMLLLSIGHCGDKLQLGNDQIGIVHTAGGSTGANGTRTTLVDGGVVWSTMWVVAVGKRDRSVRCWSLIGNVL